jgi:hypothetical protein
MLTTTTTLLLIDPIDDTPDDIFEIAPDSVRAAMREAARAVED